MKHIIISIQNKPVKDVLILRPKSCYSFHTIFIHSAASTVVLYCIHATERN